MAECAAVVATGKHRRAIFSEGQGRKVERCQSCFKEFNEVEEGEPSAPLPEPVEVTAESRPPAPPQPAPVEVGKLSK